MYFEDIHKLFRYILGKNVCLAPYRLASVGGPFHGVFFPKMVHAKNFYRKLLFNSKYGNSH